MTADLTTRPQPQSGTRSDPLTAPGWPAGPCVATVGNEKGGVGKSTIVLHLAAIAARQGWRVLVVDTDPQESAYRATRAMVTAGNDPGYTCVHEPDSGALHRIRDADGMHLVLVDTPGNITTSEVLGRALGYSDLAVICSDMTAMSVRPTVRTVNYVTACGARPVVLLNAIPPGASQMELRARQFLSHQQIPLFGGTVYRRAVHGRCIIASTPLSRAEGEDAGRACAEVLGILLEIIQRKPQSFPAGSSSGRPDEATR